MTNRKTKEIQFKIDHLDRFGQGVYKDPATNLVTFIPGTLPEEKGTATVTKSKGKVQFAKLKSLEENSEYRVQPECEYFEKCSGCQYWMTSREKESLYKQETFKRNLRSAFPQLDEDVEVTWLATEQRSHYRNRIQLHYDKKQKVIGYRDQRNNIIKIDRCLTASVKINDFLQNILTANSWLNFLRKNDPAKGHFEIYESSESDEVLFSINQDYAFGGFTQVNQATNKLMLDHLNGLFFDQDPILKKSDIVFDLFGGNGNLTKAFDQQRVLVVDGHKPSRSVAEYQEFHEINLYGQHAVERVSTLAKNPPKLMIIDPPRSGLKNLDEFIESIKPEYVLYISCQYDSMLRDLRKLNGEQFKFLNFALCDLFPATHHVEAITLIKTGL
jgi:23S rRNA (uracil1939-C5)-methyltransferase